MAEPTLDIRCGIPFDDRARVVESAEGLANARERMKTLAAEKPGEYFVFAPSSYAILAHIDTTPRPNLNHKTNAA